MLWNRDVNLGTAQSIRQNWCYLFVWKQLLNHPPKVIKAQCGFSLTFINKVQLDFAILMTNLTESMRPYIFRNFLVSLFYTKKTAPMILPSCLPMQILSQGCVYEAGNQNTAFEYYSEKVNLVYFHLFSCQVALKWRLSLLWSYHVTDHGEWDEIVFCWICLHSGMIAFTHIQEAKTTEFLLVWCFSYLMACIEVPNRRSLYTGFSFCFHIVPSQSIFICSRSLSWQVDRIGLSFLVLTNLQVQSIGKSCV